jgi:predicted TIM-barrel fold metal-dependent hydrolase
MTSVNVERIIDGDGHITEDDEMANYLPSPYKEMGPFQGRVFPALDHMHTPFRETPATHSGRGRVGPEQWIDFLNDVGIDTTVLYPTGGLAYGKIPYADVAIAVTRAYNDWLSETYMKASPRFKGMALIPMQDPEAAVVELRRAVEELGMVGAMLPSNGLRLHLGSKEFWPVYQEAERLGCALAIHGGAHDGMGLDDLNHFAAIHALGHPFGVMISFTGIIANAILDKFPGLRIGFLEAGAAWLLFCLERLDSSYGAFFQKNPRGELLNLTQGERVSDHIKRHIEAGRIFVGIEGDEPELVRGVQVVGIKPWIYSSDFPHEVTNETCKEEIQELRESDELVAAQKEAILSQNAERFYRLQ